MGIHLNRIFSAYVAHIIELKMLDDISGKCENMMICSYSII